jgi:putative membrane protein
VLLPAAATPGFWDWSLNPPLVLVLLTGALYARGSRNTLTPARTRDAQRARGACFYGALVIVAVALSSPLDTLAEQLFWVHMVQHILLMLVAAPLLVLSRPWVRLWRCLPLSARRWLARAFSPGHRAAPLAALAGFLGEPAPAFVVFSVVLLGWHVPVMFDATLTSVPLHALEHTLFFYVAVVYWKQVIPSAPLRARLTAVQRVVYVIGAMIVSWVLAVVLALAPHALYSGYAELSSRPGGISALADQQLAAGIMWVPGSVTFVIVIFVYVHRWLTPQEPASKRSPRLAGEH